MLHQHIKSFIWPVVMVESASALSTLASKTVNSDPSPQPFLLWWNEIFGRPTENSVQKYQNRETMISIIWQMSYRSSLTSKMQQIKHGFGAYLIVWGLHYYSHSINRIEYIHVYQSLSILSWKQLNCILHNKKHLKLLYGIIIYTTYTNTM